MSIDVFVAYEGMRSPFTIQQRCRLGRFYDVVSQGLNIEITEITHIRHGAKQKTLTPDQKDLYLIEQLDIKPNDIITVNGKKLGNVNLSKTEIILKYKGIAILGAQIVPQTNVKHIIDIVRQSNLFVPDSVQLSYNGNKLNQWNKLLIQDLKIKHNDVLDIEGVFLPLPKHFEHLSNLNIHMETQCVVCLEALPSHKYECGHVNVCQSCYDQGKVERCPVCNV